MLINMPTDHIKDTCEKYPEVNGYMRVLIEEELYKKQKRIESFNIRNAKVRYEGFIAANTELMNRLSPSNICSYLGMSKKELAKLQSEASKE